MTKITITLLLVAGIIAAAHWRAAFAGESVVRLASPTDGIWTRTLSDFSEVPWLKLKRRQQTPKPPIYDELAGMPLVPPKIASKFSTNRYAP